LGGSGEANERMIRIALEYGALGAKLAGAGGGGTIIALHLQPEEMIAALRAAGCSAIFYPCITDGVRLEGEGDT
ncbi:MAG: mevalonate kinase, partial [Chloroflexi bacterium]|nr:mevalonate kinase [Chloroflexota bacterium]